MKLIIFDFDGTLVDSRKLIWESHRIIFAEFGLVCPTQEESLALIGMSLELVLAQLAGAEAPIAKMTEAYKHVLPVLRENEAFAETPFDGAADLLVALAKRRDVRLGIATGHVSHAIEPALDRFGWRNFFCNVQTADRAPSKPHPGMLLQALSETDTYKDDAVMIGDTAFDMQMAVAAGIPGIGVAWGYHGAERLREAGATQVVGTMAELAQCLAPGGAQLPETLLTRL
jgi:phosphoglycolate phosphatase